MDYTAIQALTQEYIVPKLQDNIFNKTPVLQRLKAKITRKQDGGEYIKVPIIYDEATSAGWYSGNDVLLTADNDNISAVRYDWAHAYANISITHTDELTNSGKSQVISLLTSKAKIAEMTLSKKITTAIFSTSQVTDAITGFPLMVDDSTSTDYAGINASDFSNWAASVDDSSTTLTLRLLIGKFNDCSDGNEKTTLLVSNQECWEKYWQLLEAKPNFRTQSDNSTLKFMGADWVTDKAAPGSGGGTADNHIYFLNENFIQLYVHPRDDFKVGEYLKPVNQEVRISRILWTGQLTTDNRRRQGALKTINPSL